MRFCEVSPCSYFVVINSEKPSLLLVKDSEGKIRKYSTYSRAEIPEITTDTEVQVVVLKPLDEKSGK